MAVTETFESRSTAAGYHTDGRSYAVAVHRVGEAVVGDGLALPYAEHGDLDGLPLVMLHGFSDSWRSFVSVLPLLPTRLRAIALSVRGHGEAGRPSTGYTLADFSGDLSGFLDALGLQRAVIVGHSMGSMIASRFAIDHPDRVEALVLVGSVARGVDHPVLSELRDEIANQTDPVSAEFALAFQQSTLARAMPEAFLDMAVRESMKVPHRVWQAVADAMLAFDHRGELGRLTVPRAIFWGSADAVFSEADQELLRDALPGAHRFDYAGVGHALHWEEPQRFARDLGRFVHEAVAEK